MPGGTYDVWVEGYRATGEHGTASCRARGVIAPNFAEACIQVSADDPYFDAERLTSWGCRMYPTEAEAREFAG